MKVKDLIATLSRFDGDDDVHIAYPAGDYWQTVLAPAVTRVAEGEVVLDHYRGDKMIPDDREPDKDGPPVRSVVVLR